MFFLVSTANRQTFVTMKNAKYVTTENIRCKNDATYIELIKNFLCFNIYTAICF